MSTFQRLPSIRQPWRRGRLLRVITAGLTAMVVGGVGAVVMWSTPAAAATVDTSAWYELVNRNSGKALDVCGVSTADGACIQQWARSGGTNQQWQFIDAGDGYYRLRARHSGKVLDVSGASTADGATIHQWSDHGGTNQQFRLVASPDGYVRLIARHSNKAVEVQNAATDDGGRVVQYTDWGGTNQQWQLIRVGNDGGGGTCPLPSTYQ